METLAARWAGAPKVGDAELGFKGRIGVSQQERPGVQAEFIAGVQTWILTVFGTFRKHIIASTGLEDGG